MLEQSGASRIESSSSKQGGRGAVAVIGPLALDVHNATALSRLHCLSTYATPPPCHGIHRFTADDTTTHHSKPALPQLALWSVSVRTRQSQQIGRGTSQTSR